MKQLLYLILFVLTSLLLSSCQMVDVVFHGGALSGIIFVVILAVIIIYVLAKLLGKNRKALDTTKDD